MHTSDQLIRTGMKTTGKETKELFPAHIRGNVTQSCREHCINTAVYARQDLESAGLGNAAYLAGLLHDCGKFSNDFRVYIEAASAGEDVSKGSVIHTFAGVYYMLTKYHDIQPENPYDLLTSEIIAYSIGAHHGLFDCISEDRKNGFIHRLRKQPDYEKDAIDNFSKYCCSEEDVDDYFRKASKEIEAYTNSLAVLASNNQEINFYLGLIARLISSAVMDGDRRDTAEFMTDNSIAVCKKATPELWAHCRSNLEALLESFSCDTEIQQARRQISDLCLKFADKPTGIYRLNVPTGGGKTLASLRYALAHAEKYNKKRIIYTAPLISILDQNARVIRDAIGAEDILLEHHSSVLRSAMNEEELSKYEILAQTWDAPVVVTTLVQLLDTLFSGKTSCIRRFQSLCDSVIIIDEVQTVPVKMLSMFNLAMNFISKLCGATVILCSATQPCFEDLKAHKMHISETEIISEEKYIELEKVFRRTELKDAGNMALDEVPEFAESVLENNDSLLIICNTKKEASQIFGVLKENHDKCYHLSASMCMAHRKEVLSKVYQDLNSDEKVILVSTQVIEAGVDISFGAVIRISAGLDNIVQAAGRCNRNGEQGVISPVYIVRCEDERLGSLADIIRSQDATNNLLCSFSSNPERFNNSLNSSESIKYYYSSLYNSAGNLFDYPIDHNTLLSLLSDNLSFADGAESVNEYVLHQAFKDAGNKFEMFDQESESVIVPYGEGMNLIAEMQTERAKYDYMYMKYLLERAKEYSVSVYSNQINKLIDSGGLVSIAEGEILVLQENWYDSKTGLNTEPVEKEADECNILIS